MEVVIYTLSQPSHLVDQHVLLEDFLGSSVTCTLGRLWWMVWNALPLLPVLLQRMRGEQVKRWEKRGQGPSLRGPSGESGLYLLSRQTCS